MARSAAARDGLSVGDWLTRRIYTESLQDTQEMRIEPPAQPATKNYRDNREDDARRDRDELMHRLARTEAETESAFRRIDETLRALGRRLETSERSQNEAKISVHTAATELNAVTREQAQNFTALESRIEKVEHAADSSALRNAVRGLHQGVSRLAEQAAKSANDSSVRIEALAQSIDGVSKFAQATRAESAHLAKNFAQSIDGVSKSAQTSRAESAHLAKDIGERINALTEKLAQSDERFESLETRVQDVLGQHVASVDGGFEEIAGRLDQAAQDKGEQVSSFEETVKGLKQRLDASEKHNQEVLSEYRLSLEEMRRRLDSMDAAPLGFAPQAFEPEPLARARTAAESVAPTAFVHHTDSGTASGTDTAQDFGRYLSRDSGRNLGTDFGAQEDSSFDLPPFPDVEPSFGASDTPDLSPEPKGDFDYPSAGPSADHELPSTIADMDDEFVLREEAPHSTDVARDYLAEARRAANAGAQTETRNAGPGLAGGRLSLGRDTSERGRVGLRRPLLGIAAGILLLVGVGYLILSSGLSPFTNEIGTVQAALPPAAANASETDFAELPPIEGPYSAPVSASGEEAATPEETPTPAGALTTLPSAVNQAPTYSSNIDQYASLNAPSTPSLATTPAPPLPEPSPEPPSAANNQSVSGPELSAPQSPVSNTPSPLERLLSQARGGSPAAALLVGLKYLDGDGVAASDSEGARWLRTAAELGEPVAQYRLGSIFERGRGVAADASQAAFRYEQAARSGNRKAMHNLAVAYADGLGIEKHLAEAARWFRSAADFGLTDSQFNLAVLYERGLGVPSSLNEAFKWYLIAADQGDAEARSRVEVLATQLPEEQRLTAERAAASYAPQPLDQAANEPPTLAQIQ